MTVSRVAIAVTQETQGMSPWLTLAIRRGGSVSIAPALSIVCVDGGKPNPGFPLFLGITMRRRGGRCDLTDRIKFAVEGTWLLVKQAYETRAWSVLGYASWDDYCSREFGSSRLRLPREERQDVVASLRESGLSIRAIAAATGASDQTVQHDLQVSQITTPDEASQPEWTDDVIAALTRIAEAMEKANELLATSMAITAGAARANEAMADIVKRSFD